MTMRSLLVALDFDGLLIDSYRLLAKTFENFDLNVGDETRFRNRRKFLKYFGGGRELLSNLATIALPKKKKIREKLTEVYSTDGRIYSVFVPYINACIASEDISVGIVSRNYTLHPGPTIRTVLAASGVHEAGLDFLIPLSVGAKKTRVLEGMRASSAQRALFAGDEISDYHAGVEAGYTTLVGAYGFDHLTRLRERTDVPPTDLFEHPDAVAHRLWAESRDHMSPAALAELRALKRAEEASAATLPAPTDAQLLPV